MLSRLRHGISFTGTSPNSTDRPAQTLQCLPECKEPRCPVIVNNYKNRQVFQTTSYKRWYGLLLWPEGCSPSLLFIAVRKQQGQKQLGEEEGVYFLLQFTGHHGGRVRNTRQEQMEQGSQRNTAIGLLIKAHQASILCQHLGCVPRHPL